MPANRERALDKARELDADALIFDLEDAVAPNAKAQARTMACERVAAGGYGSREVLVRTNALGSPWFEDDLAALAQVPVHGVVIPKVDSAAQASSCVQRLRALGSTAPVWAMIESPAGVSAAGEIAATPGVAALVMGTNDLLKELNAVDTPDRRALWYALGKVVNAARANGLTVLDGVSPLIDDAAALRAVCEQGRIFGFDGKTLIHPRQIEPANAAFGPDPNAVATARRLVAAWAAAPADAGVIAVEGRMVEQLHVEQARALLAFAEAIEQR